MFWPIIIRLLSGLIFLHNEYNFGRTSVNFNNNNNNNVISSCLVMC